MAHLGLLPPYTSEDIEQAYRSLAAKAHPDRGGTAADFIALQSAYEHAKEYVEFRADKDSGSPPTWRNTEKPSAWRPSCSGWGPR